MMEQESNFNNPGTDGYNMAFNAAGIVQEFLNPGETFEQALVRSGMPINDAMDYAMMYRKGIAFRVPAMVLYAEHALMASAGADRMARHEGLQAVIGRLANNQEKQASKARRLFDGMKGNNQDEISG